MSVYFLSSFNEFGEDLSFAIGTDFFCWDWEAEETGLADSKDVYSCVLAVEEERSVVAVDTLD